MINAELTKGIRSGISDCHKLYFAVGPETQKDMYVDIRSKVNGIDLK